MESITAFGVEGAPLHRTRNFNDELSKAKAEAPTGEIPLSTLSDSGKRLVVKLIVANLRIWFFLWQKLEQGHGGRSALGFEQVSVAVQGKGGSSMS